jgi:antitoxin VapB
MMITRTFKSGNSLAIRIPKEIAFMQNSQQVDIERKGDCLIIRPLVSASLTNLTDVLASFPAGFMAEGRELNDQKERDWPLKDQA